MANDNELSGAIVREYFVKNGGKVKRDDLFDHFRSLLDKFNDQGSSKNRFGDIVNSIASLQNVEGEKYFVLKKTKTTPVLIRRQARQVNHRKDKGVSLPASMRNFRFSAAEDAFGNLAIPDSKIRPSAATRARAGFKSESSAKEAGLRRNNSDTSVTENGQANDSGVDTAVSSLQSDSPRGSRQSSFSKGSEYDRLSQNSGDTGIFNEDDHYEHDVPSHVLTSLEKSWMMSTMAGNKSEIVCQLEEDPNIVSFKDFMVGYTALHWAAKQGNEDIVRLLVGAGAIVNVKSNGGYTPLHLATMHGKVNIINLLIDEYHANVHIHDHSGKEAKDVLTKNSTEQIKQKLADPRAAVALEEMAKKFPAIAATGKTRVKKFGKVLGRKHAALSHHSQVDGELPCKFQRSHSEPLGSAEDGEDVGYLVEVERGSRDNIFVKVGDSDVISDESSVRNEEDIVGTD